MAYLAVPHLGAPALPGQVGGPEPGSQEAESAIKRLLMDLGSRKEFYSLRYAPADSSNSSTRGPVDIPGFRPSMTLTGTPDRDGRTEKGEFVFHLIVPGFSLHGAQLFLRNLFNPNTPYPRILIDWQTGTGKSIAVISIAHEFVRQFRLFASGRSGSRSAPRGSRPAAVPTVFVVGFTRSIIIEDMLKYPELGFISVTEVEDRRRLRVAAELAGPSSPEARQLSGFNGMLRRRITDRARGGYYQFYGYKEFANRLFQVTRQGAARGFNVQTLYEKSLKGAQDEEFRLFGERLAREVRRGDVIVNDDLVESMKGGLLVADETHNAYNMVAKNQYGVAIQYVLDILGDDAPRAAFMSATPLSGSAEEVIDLGNLLIPRSALPGGVPLRREDFFAPRRRAAGGAASSTARPTPASGRDPPPVVTPFPDLQVDVPDGPSAYSGEPISADELDALAASYAAPTSSIVDASTLVSESESALSDLGFSAEAAEDEAEEEAADIPVSQLLPGALEKIGHLLAGRVSFLLDTDVTAYPRRELEGTPLPGIDYLRFILCPMSSLHEETLDSLQEGPAPPGEESKRRAVPPNAATLYDMVFPNPAFTVEQLEGKSRPSPDGGVVGLYLSGDTPAKLAAAPQEWRDAVGVTVLKGAEAGLPAGVPLVTGPFLRLPTLGHYSGKYAKLAREVLEIVKHKPGKIMVFHPRVRMSGVLIIQEVMRMNGFVDETSSPTDTTICSICGDERRGHDAPPKAHKYMPARFVIAHSSIDRAVRERSLGRFNAPANLNGELFRLIIGSTIIREGANFRAVNYQFVLSLPTDIPTLIQVFGRDIRKDSHAELPPERRFVQVMLLVSVRQGHEHARPQAAGAPEFSLVADPSLGGAARDPDVRRYGDKMLEYLVIQMVERVLRRYAMDGFANYGRLTSADASLADRATLESLPYRPLVTSQELSAAGRPLALATFEAYGHGEREVSTITSILRVLFRARPVWKYSDLWAAARSGAVKGVGYDPALFTEGNFALALREVSRLWGSPPVAVVSAPPFYVLASADGTGRPVADVESYIRAVPGSRGGAAAPPAVARIRVKDFLLGKGQDKRFAALLRGLEAQYLRPSAPNPLDAALVDLSASVHYGLLKRLVERAAGIVIFEPFKTFFDQRGAALVALYTRYRVLVTADMILKNPEAASTFKGTLQQLQAMASDTPLGYATPRSIRVLAQTAGGSEWQDMAHSAVGFGKRYRENDITVGFTDASLDAAHSTAGPSAAGSSAAKFKLRPPLHRLRERGGRDARSLTRGAVCETRPKEELAATLLALLAARGAQRPPMRSSHELCQAIKMTLLELELTSRTLPSGMIDGLRYVYLFADRQPSLASAMG